MIITKMALPRRTFLRGLGATLALPLLDAMVPALTRRRRRRGRPVRRLGVVYIPNGAIMGSGRRRTDGALRAVADPLSRSSRSAIRWWCSAA